MVAYTSSRIRILSLALARLGENPISSIDPDDPVANLANAFYDLHVKTALIEHPWRFALFYQNLAALDESENDRSDRLDYVYQIPDTMLTVVGLEYGAYYEMYGTKLYTNENPASVLHVKNVEASEFPEFFSLAISYRITAELAQSLAEDQTMRANAERDADKYMKKARAINSRQSFRDLRINDNVLRALNAEPERRW